MTKTSSVAYLSERLDEEWPAFRDLVRSVPGEEMELPGVVDEWSLKELLGHVSFWSRKGAKDVRLATAGKASEIETPGTQARVDEWNAKAAAEARSLPADVVQTALEEGNAEARQAVGQATDAALAIELDGWSVGHRFAEDTYRHYREHGEQIRSWKQGLETTEA